MRSLSSKIKSVVELTGGVSRALQLSQRYGDSTSKMTVVSSKDGASEWVEFSEHFAYHLTSILCVLHKHGDEFRTISGDFVVELAFMLDAECDIAATITTEMRTFNNKELRASYDFKADGPNHNSARQHRKYRDVTVRSLCTILTFLSRGIQARILRATSGTGHFKSTALKDKVLNLLKPNQIAINALLNSTELIYHAVEKWGSDIYHLDLLDDKEAQKVITSNEQLLTAYQALCGPHVSELQYGVNLLWSFSLPLLQYRQRLCGMKADLSKHPKLSPKEVINAARLLQQNQEGRLTPSELMPLADFKEGMAEFCAYQRKVCFTDQEKAAAVVMQKVLTVLAKKRKALNDLLTKQPDCGPFGRKNRILREKLVLAIALCCFCISQLHTAIEDCPAAKSRFQMIDLGCKGASSKPPTQDMEDDPDESFSQLLSVLAEV